jgi:hypothetical protein
MENNEKIENIKRVTTGVASLIVHVLDGFVRGSCLYYTNGIDKEIHLKKIFS